MHRPTRRPLLRGTSGRIRAPLSSIGLLAIIVASAGCGPFGYLKKVASDATRAVADVEAMGAEEYAPYEYWGAVAYLEQAKVLMGYSEYERSFDYADRAQQLANQAKEKVQRVRQGKSVVRDDNIAAPDELVDAEGNKIDSVDEAYESKPQDSTSSEGEGEAGGAK